MRLVFESRDEYDSEWAAIASIAEKSGMRRRCCASGSARRRPTPASGRLTSEERERIRELERENRELRRANEILKSGGGFLRGGARPPTETMIAFIDRHRHRHRETAGLRWGVEPICARLPIAPRPFTPGRSGHGRPAASATRY